MISQILIEKLEASDEYKRFIEKNPTAYLCSGFFDINSENDSENKYHFDFYVSATKKTFSFQIEDGKFVELERNYEEKILAKVLLKKYFDFDKIKEKIAIEMELEGIKSKIQKMIFSLQNLEGKDILLGTIFLSGLGLLKVNIDVYDNQIIDFEKKSLFDMIKIIPKKGK